MTPNIYRYVTEAKRYIRLKKRLAKDNKSVGLMTGKASIKEDNAPLGENGFIHKGLS